ncbi:DUF6858 family protein [Arcobacter sp. FWKO B]|uniref:DUF6858 family protein n=1 Tax=Arcobacter sp. FWKO B TaxID=2593672 RepID=UPI0018A69C72|nr:hypothetical protein [Arcobacter sp. FWKO B]QOG11902.1 hypothetical protein FWKOB_03930 [Arcobacter sp. FWKO B]
MKQMLFKEKYPVFTLEVSKSETTYKNIDEIFVFLKQKIDSHPVAKFIAIFDHMSHTKSFEDNVIAEGIIDAKNLVFCFGKEIPTSKILAVRPRSIGICEFKDHFDISILEVPNENLHKVLENWIKEIGNKNS